MNQPQTRRDQVSATRRATRPTPLHACPLVGGQGVPLTVVPSAVSPCHPATVSPCQVAHYESIFLSQIVATVNEAFPTQSWPYRFAKYRENPYAFARDILGSNWWRMQREVAEAVVNHRRIVVKS